MSEETGVGAGSPGTDGTVTGSAADSATVGRPAAQAPARVLGGYALDQPIGRGPTGQVWSSRDAAGNPVAIKVVRRDLAADAALVAGVLQVRASLAHVDNCHVVRVRDVVTGGGELAVVTDLVAAPDLRATMRTKPTLVPADALTLAAGILDGLGAIHAAGLVHGDLRPENVLVVPAAPTFTPRITDAGIARAVAGSAQPAPTAVVGAPEYMAPEVADTAMPGPAADVYSAGILLYEMLFGMKPFGGGTPVAVLRRHLVEAAPVRPRRVDDELWLLVAGLVDKDPAARPPAAYAAGILAATARQRIGQPAFPSPGAAGAGMPDVTGVAMPSAAPAAGTRPGPAPLPPVLLAPAVPVVPAQASAPAASQGPPPAAPHPPLAQPPLSAPAPGQSVAKAAPLDVQPGVPPQVAPQTAPSFGAQAPVAPPQAAPRTAPQATLQQAQTPTESPATAALAAPEAAPDSAAPPGATAADEAASKGRPHRQRRRVLVAAAAVVVLAAGGGAAVALTGGGSSSSPASSTPDVVAQPSAPPIPGGLVEPTPTDPAYLYDTPSASASPPPTSTSLAKMPNLVGSSLSDAQTQLESAGITPKVVDLVDESAIDGTVLKQSPTPGTAKPSAVTLTVARQAVVSYLSDMQPVPSAPYGIETGSASVDGKPYAHSLSYTVSANSDPTSVEYDLGRHYQRFRATVGMSDSTSSDAAVLVELFADGRPVWSATVRVGKTAPVDIDVTNALRLKVSATYAVPSEYSEGGTAVLGNARVLGLKSEVPTPSPSDSSPSDTPSSDETP